MIEGTYTPRDVAARLNITEQTLRLWMRKGKLKAKKVGGEWRIEKEELERFINGQSFRENKQDIDLIKLCQFELNILGTNALGPLHQGRFHIKTKLENGVRVKILLLDPNSDAFFKKAYDEETAFGGTPSGRLRKESEASFAICRDLADFVNYRKNIDPNTGIGSIEVKMYSKMPSKSLIIIDPETREGRCNVNIYPEDTSWPGLRGTQKTVGNTSLDMEEFTSLKEEFNEMWDEVKELPFPFELKINNENIDRKNVFLINLKLQFKHAILAENKENNRLIITNENLESLKKEYPLEYTLLQEYIKLGTVMISGSVG